jgi:hypothetical protein
MAISFTCYACFGWKIVMQAGFNQMNKTVVRNVRCNAQEQT